MCHVGRGGGRGAWLNSEGVENDLEVRLKV